MKAKVLKVSGLEGYVDISALEALCTGFSDLFGVATAILNIDGHILVSARWQTACTQFHRKNPTTAARCLESDTVLASKLDDGNKYNVYRCRNGLVDVAVPIKIQGQHVANLFAGQFFFESPSTERFEAQARDVGFAPELYLKAIDEVPVVKESQIRLMMELLCQLAEIIGETGYVNKSLEVVNSQLESQSASLTAALEKVRKSELELSSSQKLLSSVVNSTPGIILLKDPISSEIKFLNNYGEEVLQIFNGDITAWAHYDQPRYVSDFLKQLDKLPAQKLGHELEAEVVLKNGSYDRTFMVKKVEVKTNESSDNELHLVVCTDITNEVEAKKESEFQLYYDVLTGLPNVNSLKRDLKNELLISSRDAKKLAFLFVDLDGFKHVNDISGHDVGDAIISMSANRILDVANECKVYRFGGDEFIVILPEISDNILTSKIAARINGVVKKPYRIKDEEYHISASIGISIYPDDGLTGIDLLRCADQAMYSSKNKSKGSYAYFKYIMQVDANQKSNVAKALRNAVVNEELELYYQPIVDMVTGEIYKAEALLRWSSPTEGNVSPAFFIPIAEQTGIIHEISEWVFLTALQQSKKWSSLVGRLFQISVNKSPVQFKLEKSDHSWLKLMDDYGISGRSLCIEITEGVLLENDDSVQKSFDLYRDRGIEVAIDDFGTGFSALSYLNKFDIDYLKIDKVFIDNLAVNKQDYTLCEAIILMANKLGIKVVAEGVENEDQVILLGSIGCDFIQGYYYYKPMPSTDFEAVLLD